ncbi:hypothetical protein GCM10007276_24690 [Agaricicola taiwanensis]|uniref:UrcA family protein n=1 Tax=Agaricicola taiwanensis TaxID=591372 RepID=A0A8J2YJ49_9RHOB|nr:hypothetical protein [Agaricicola taiwanensis]GGE46560.1 hypothetical protein GCM10007276_24690 [Agaricicola taiwanensis]
MTKPLLGIAAGLILLSAGAAVSQPMRASPLAPIEGALRVQVNMSLTAPTSDDMQKQREIQEQLRAAHYEIASTECDRLSAVFKQDCALVALTVQVAQNRDEPNADTITSTANAQFRLTKR